MKTAEDVFGYSGQFIANALERPRMYAPSAECLELILSEYDALQDFIVFGSDHVANGMRRYAAFLSSQGYGSASFSSYCRMCEQEEPTFEQIVDLWRRYLEVRPALDPEATAHP